MSIRELRILPPLAIARLGSSSEPLENYELVVEDPLGHRRIKPSETLRVDAKTGEITEAYLPPEPIAFRDGKSIRPVAPFLEVFARTGSDTLEPLTLKLLDDEGLKPGGLSGSWGDYAAFAQCSPETGAGPNSWPKPEPSAPL